MFKLAQRIPMAAAHAFRPQPAAARVPVAVARRHLLPTTPSIFSASTSGRLLHQTSIRRNADPTISNKQLLPEFSLKDKVVVVSGGGRGVGLVQAQAVLEAGATGKL
jgi:hypothetical protein